MAGSQANARGERRAAQRDALLAAGLELFGTRGYHATSVEDVCRAARVTREEFDEHFTDTEDLLAAVHAELTVELSGNVLAALELEPSGLARRARAGISAFARTLADDERKARVVLLESWGVSRRIEEHRRQVRRAFADVIARDAERAATSGEIPRRRFELIATALVGAVYEALLFWLTADERPPIDEVTEECVRLLVAAAGAP